MLTQRATTSCIHVDKVPNKDTSGYAPPRCHVPRAQTTLQTRTRIPLKEITNRNHRPLKCIFLSPVTFDDVPNIACAAIPGVCVYAFLPVFGRALSRVEVGTKGHRSPATQIRGRAPHTGQRRRRKWEQRERGGKEKGPREKERKKERERETQQETIKKMKKQTQKHELTLREMQKKRKHQFWIDEETFHTKTVIKEPASRELCAVGTRFNKK